jgi:nucleotide-binding universal stress UspA family protein
MDEKNGDGLTVVALVEGKGSDQLVAERAERLARGSGGRVILLEVLPLIDASIPREGGGQPRIEPWQQMESKAATQRRRLTQLGQSLAVPTEVAVRFGPVEEILPETAQQADLVVAAARPSRWFPWTRRDRDLVAVSPTPVALVEDDDLTTAA